MTLVGTALACLAVSLGLVVEGGLGTKAKVVIRGITGISRDTRKSATSFFFQRGGQPLRVNQRPGPWPEVVDIGKFRHQSRDSNSSGVNSRILAHWVMLSV